VGVSRRWPSIRRAWHAAKRRSIRGQIALGFRPLLFEALDPRQLLAPVAAGPWGDDAEGESSADVSFRLEFTDSTGAVATQVQPGTDVWLSVFVRDARAPAAARGVYAAYLDVAFPDELLAVAMQPGSPWGFDIEFGPEYLNGPWAELAAPGEIDEVGAFQTGSSPLGSDEFLLFRTRFIAGGVQAVADSIGGVAEDSQAIMLDVLANDLVRLGTAEVAANPADRSPGSDVVLFAPPVVVPVSRIDYGAAQLDIALSDAQLITAVTQPATGGTVAIAFDGRSLLYTPPRDFFGQEQFTYTVGRVQTAAVTVQVEPVNDAPVAGPDAYTASRVGTLRVDRLHGVLRNDSDVERDPISAVLVSNATHGTLVLRTDGSFDYTPDEGFVGVDQFRYVARDASVWSMPATVTIDVGNPQAGVRLEVVDAAGTPLTTAEAGETVWVRGWVRDLRDGSVFRQGLGSVYLDLAYDPAAFQPVIDPSHALGFVVDFAEGYRSAISGDALQAGVVDELGAASDHLFPPGGGEQLLFSMPFETGGPHVADDSYDISFQSLGNILDVLTNDHDWQWSGALAASAADTQPAHAVRTWEPYSPIPEAEVIWSDATLTLVNAADLVISSVGPTSQGGQVTITSDRRRLVYAPAPGFVGSDSFEYEVRDAQGRVATAMVVLDVVSGWQNVHQPLDVNSDTFVTPLDALLVINYLNSGLPRKLTGTSAGPPFWDVQADGFVSPVDALWVINYLNQIHSGGGEGEGEGSWSGTAEESSVGHRSDMLRELVPEQSERAESVEADSVLLEPSRGELSRGEPFRSELGPPRASRRVRWASWLWADWLTRDLPIHSERNLAGRLGWP
jgi:hypothetical protein